MNRRSVCVGAIAVAFGCLVTLLLLKREGTVVHFSSKKSVVETSSSLAQEEYNRTKSRIGKEQNQDLIRESDVGKTVNQTGGLRIAISADDRSRNVKAQIVVIQRRTGKVEADEVSEGVGVGVEIANLSVGEKYVVVIPYSSNLAPAYVESIVVQRTTSDAVVTLAEGTSSQGVVMDETGAPIAGAEVTATIGLGYSIPADDSRPFYGIASVSSEGSGWSFSSDGIISRSIRTDKDGTFVIQNVGWGPVKLSAKRASAASCEQWVAPGANARLVLSR